VVEEDHEQQVTDPVPARGGRGRRTAVVIGLPLIALLIVAVLGLPAVFAPPDVATPAGAELLASDIRSSLGTELELRVPAYRVALRNWEQSGESSYLVTVEVYDIRFGLSSRRAMVVAPCWQPGRPFAAGWINEPPEEADIRAEFAVAIAGCA
jgi:hypothetical protein